MKMKKQYKVILLILALVFLFFMVYSPHFSYRFPFHVDEWHHITEAKHLGQKGIVEFFNFENHFRHPFVQIGFKMLLLFLDFFFDIVLIYKFLPAINAVIIGAVLFYFLNKKFNYWIGLLGILFLASLKSNISIIGMWFFTPVMAGFSLIYICLFFIEKSVEDKKIKYFYFGLFFWGLLALVHQSSALLIAFVILTFYLFKHKFVITNYKWFLPLLLSIFPIILGFFIFQIGMGSFLKKFIFPPGIPQISFDPILFYGFILSFFALSGYYFSFKQKKLLSFRIYIFIPLINLYMFKFTDFTILSAYQRYIYHFMIAAVPLSAFGFYYFFKEVYLKIKRYTKKFTKAIIVLCGLFLIMTFFYGYYDVPANVSLYEAINESDYEAMTFLRDYSESKYLVNLPNETEVISDRNPGSAIPSLTGKSSLNGIYFLNWDYVEESERFFEGNCSEKKKIITEKHKHGPYPGLKYVYSYSEIDCDFLKKIYGYENIYIYLINREKI